jgi:hypothetical protein
VTTTMADLGPLTVLIGAGASFDCFDGATGNADSNYRPPLVNDLFKYRPAFDAILNKYPGARALSDDIRTKVEAGNPLEEVLRRFTADDSPVRRTAWQIPLYLQEVMGEVGDRYISHGATKFETLLIAVLWSRFRTALLLTVNYDLFLERAIDGLMNHPFADINRDYLWGANDKKWGLVKLHGSVNWGRRLVTENRAASWRPALAAVGERLAVDETFLMLGGHSEEYRSPADEFHYPALSIPIAGKTDFVCPSQHLVAADETVAQSTHLLVIGFSGIDTHVLERFVKPMEQLREFRIVCGNLDTGKAVLARFAAKHRVFDRQPDSVVFDGGFVDFVKRGALDGFLGA